MRSDIYPAQKSRSGAAERKEDRPALAAYFRSVSHDGDLLTKFGLNWWVDVDPLLDSEGRLTSKHAQELLGRLREYEYIFDLKLAKLPADEQEHQRGRYTLWKKFLQSAIADNAPIYTIA